MPDPENKLVYLLTTDEIGVIGKGLAELQFKVAAPVVSSLQSQLNAHVAAETAAGAKPTETAPPRRAHRATKPTEPATPPAPPAPADPATPPAE